MSIRADSVPKLLPQVLGIVTLADVALLFVQDASSRLFPALSHDSLAGSSLAMIAGAYMISQWTRRPGFMELGKAILLAAAFLFWAANQFWPDLPQAALFNDIAIGLFILDVFLAITGWPAGLKEKAFLAAGGCNCVHCEKG